MFLGIEIGGTKLQLGLGAGDGQLVGLWRGGVTLAEGGAGIRQQIEAAIPQLLQEFGIARDQLRGIGVGFGGPTDDATQSVIKSHHVSGWTGFPLAAWLRERQGLPTVICNDADVAGLAEALHGAGRELSPIFYMTVGSGIGGGLVIDGKIYRGVGQGAGEVGHLRPAYPLDSPLAGGILEDFASGWGIARVGEAMGLPSPVTGQSVADAARKGDTTALTVLDEAAQALAEGVCSVIKLLCPRRIVIGGGVSLLGDDLFFAPIRRYVAERGFAAFAGLTDIVPAELGEEVVIHGALALARQQFS
ncbi:MAG: ROK family protein [Bacteroidales bacterium]|nr:ROK family protein [Bacteroidales bacterium]